jgi:hypothetical protein
MCAEIVSNSGIKMLHEVVEAHCIVVGQVLLLYPIGQLFSGVIVTFSAEHYL